MILTSLQAEAYRKRLETTLERTLPPATQTPEQLHTAMRYVVLNGGKRLRPLLIYLCGEALNIDATLLDKPACAVELIHAYSLVHDDLPAMDNDDFRRGQPTCHKMFDEATAILVGDALQSLAFQLICEPSPTLCPAQQLAMIDALAKASGSQGMAGGQALDLSATRQAMDLNTIELMYHLKTGALIKVCIELCLLAAPAAVNETMRHELRCYAHHLGLAFQIRDDIHDIESNFNTRGKIPGNDQKQHKSTYVATASMAQAKAQVIFLQQTALNALANWDNKANHLRQLIREILAL